jgi:hypothetical protein
VEARERDLRGAGEIEVVGFEAIDLVGVPVDEAGALHDLRQDQGRGDHRDEAVLKSERNTGVEQAEFEAGTGAGQEVEARARDPRAAGHVDRAEALGEVEVVLGLEPFGREIPWRADDLAHDIVVLAARRHAVDDDIADRHQQRVALGDRGIRRRLQFLDLGRDRLGLGEQRLLGLTLRRGDLLAHGLLPGAELLELGQRGPSLGVGVDDLVDERGVVPARDLAGLDPVGVVGKNFDVNHPGSLSARAHRLRWVSARPREGRPRMRPDSRRGLRPTGKQQRDPKRDHHQPAGGAHPTQPMGRPGEPLTRRAGRERD